MGWLCDTYLRIGVNPPQYKKRSKLKMQRNEEEMEVGEVSKMR
jgi:hypothetical protein